MSVFTSDILPDRYSWLKSLNPQPKMVAEALKLYGTLEGSGKLNSPTILGWAAELGLQAVYTADAIPWCGLFMAVVAKRAEKDLPPNPLWALNWCKFGDEAHQPELGDVLVFTRDGGGHVTLYVGEDKAGYYHCLGGNQSDMVCITRIEKKRLYGARQPIFKIAKPNTVKPYVLSANGTISTNEA